MNSFKISTSIILLFQQISWYRPASSFSYFNYYLFCICNYNLEIVLCLCWLKVDFEEIYNKLNLILTEYFCVFISKIFHFVLRYFVLKMCFRFKDVRLLSCDWSIFSTTITFIFFTKTILFSRIRHMYVAFGGYTNRTIDKTYKQDAERVVE